MPTQVSRNLFQYFGADTEIVSSSHRLDPRVGNIISIQKGDEVLSSVLPSYPIRIERRHGVCVRNTRGEQQCHEFEDGMGAVFLRPLPDERLELLIWGYDDDGLQQAARLLPLLTGVGQPEYIIVSKKCAWKGAGGVIALGSFNAFWNISEASFAR